VKVQDSAGNNLSNIPIIVKIVKTFNDSNAILDLPQYFNDSGEMSFTNLMVYYFR